MIESNAANVPAVIVGLVQLKLSFTVTTALALFTVIRFCFPPLNTTIDAPVTAIPVPWKSQSSTSTYPVTVF